MRLVLFAALLCACSSQPFSGDGGTGGGSSGAGGGSQAIGTCGDLAVPCGVLGSGGAGSIDCGTCFFDRVKLDALAAGTSQPSMLSTPQGLVIAWFNSGTLTLSRELSDGGFSSEVIGTGLFGNFPTVSLARAPDSTLRIAYTNSFDIMFGTEDAGMFSSEKIGSGYMPSLAIDSAGRPHLAYEQLTIDTKSVRHKERNDDGGWSETVVETIDSGYLGVPKLLFDAQGAAHFLYVVDSSTAESGLHHASGSTREVLTPGGLGGGANGQLDAVFDSAGALHVVWPAYPFQLMYGKRTAAGWSVTPASSDNAGHQNTALALDMLGRPVVAFHTFSALKLSAFNGSSFSVQGVQSCDQGGLALAFDPMSRLRLVSACGRMSVLTRNGQYPAGHAEGCAMLSDQVCSLACGACKAADGDCCMIATGHGSCTNRCELNIGGLACFDATKPQSMFDACVAAAGGLICAMPTTDGVDLRGTGCDAVFATP